MKNIILSLILIFICGQSAAAQRPELYVQTGHAATVNHVAFSADGKLLASASDDETIKLWLVETRSEIRTFAGHKSDVSAVAFHPRANILASASQDKTVKFWDIETGAVIRALDQHTESVTAIAFSPDGQTLVSASRDKTAKIWNAATGAEIRTLTGHAADVSAVAFAPDGATIATGSWDGTIKIWQAETGKLVKNLGEKLGYVDAVAFSPDGKFITANGKFWDAATGAEIELFDFGAGAIAFSPDGKMLASAGGDNAIALWKMEKGATPRTVTGEKILRQSGIEAVAFSPDGKLLASGSSDKTVRFWDVSRLKENRTLAAHEEKVNAVAVSPNGKFFATGDDGATLKIWNAETGVEKHSLKAGSIVIYAAAFSPDGKTVASAGDELKLWDAETGKEIWRLPDYEGLISAIAFSPDGQTITGAIGKTVKIWNAATGAEQRVWQAHTGDIGYLAASVDGKKIVTSGEDGKIKVWNAADGREIYSINGGSRTGSLAFADPVAFHPNGKFLAIGGFTIRLADVESGAEVRKFEFPASASTQIAFSPDGKMLAAGKLETVEIWNVEDGAKIRTLTGHRESVRAVGFSPDGTQLISGSRDKTAKIWNLNDDIGLSISPQSLNAHTVEFAPDASAMALFGAGYYGEIALWDLKNGERLSDLTGTGAQVGAVAFHPTKPLVASYDWANNLIIFDRNTSRKIKVKNNAAIKGGMSGSLRFSNDGTILLIAFVDGSRVFWEHETDKFQVGNTNPTLEELIAKNFPREFASNQARMLGFYKLDNSKITLLNPETKQELCSLLTLDRGEWLVVTPEGFFDGTPQAWKQTFWRFGGKTFETGAVELYFNDFHTPNLLQNVLTGNAPQLKAGFDLNKIDRRQPRVEITRVNGQTATKNPADKRAATIEIEVTDNAAAKQQPEHGATGGAQDVRLFRNNSLVKIWRGDAFSGADGGCQLLATKPEEPRRAVCRAEIPLTAGANDLTAYAFNSSNVKSADDAAQITGAEALRRGGTLYVLAIGVNEYAAPRVVDLRYAVPDVEKIALEIVAEQNKLKQYARTETVTLTDANATREMILHALRRFAGDAPAAKTVAEKLKTELAKIKTSQPEDALIIYFAGHGTTRGQRFYLVPHDYTAAGANALDASAVSDAELNDALERVDAGKLLMIIDACESGQALGEQTAGRAPKNSKGLAQLAYDKGMYILTAAQSRQAALETSKLGHGLLTFSLLEGMRNADADANAAISERELFNYAVRQVPQLQLQYMRDRDAEIKKTPSETKRQLVIDDGADETAEAALPPEKRRLQTPRLFYRRETGASSIVLAKP